LAAQRIGREDTAGLDRLVLAADTAVTVADLTALNTAFHAEVCRLSGNSLLSGLMESLHDRLQWIYRQSAVDRAPHSWAEHEALAAAIRAGDVEAAVHAAHTHVLAAREAALAVIDQRPTA
jgi:DNA-binding GntR family transcriptional regulator